MPADAPAPGAAQAAGPCTCLTDIDTKLAETGHYLDQTILAGALVPGGVDRPLITIMRKDKWIPETRRGKKGKFIPSFCPFCGVRYPEPPTDRALGAAGADAGRDGTGVAK